MTDQLPLLFNDDDVSIPPPISPNSYVDEDTLSNRPLANRDIYGGEQRPPNIKTHGRHHSAYHSSRLYLLGY
jgi:hypothetical protein